MSMTQVRKNHLIFLFENCWYRPVSTIPKPSLGSFWGVTRRSYTSVMRRTVVEGSGLIYTTWKSGALQEMCKILTYECFRFSPLPKKWPPQQGIELASLDNEPPRRISSRYVRRQLAYAGGKVEGAAAPSPSGISELGEGEVHESTKSAYSQITTAYNQQMLVHHSYSLSLRALTICFHPNYQPICNTH